MENKYSCKSPSILLIAFVAFSVLLTSPLTPHSSLSTLHSQQLYFPPVSDTTWSTSLMSDLGWCEQNLDTLIRYLDRNDTKAFIVLKDGRMVIEWYQGARNKDSIWYWASAGKTVTSTLVGVAQQEGKLSINDKTSKYLGSGWTSMTQEQEDKITVLNQLTMTSGLDDAGDPYCTLPSCLKYKAEPNTRWAYHNAPYTLLDKVIESATGGTLNTYYRQKLCNTIGMDGLFFKDGYNNVLISTPRAMARFGLLALNKFVWDNTPILTDETYAHNAVTRSQELNKSYGYLWWLNGQESFMLPGLQFVFPGPITPNAPPDAFNGLGKNDQIVCVVPSENLVVVRMGDPATPDGPDVPTTFVNELWSLLRNVICNVSSVPSATFHVPSGSKFHVPGSTFPSSLLRRDDNTSVHLFDILGNELDENSVVPSCVYFVVEKANNGSVIAIQKVLVQ